MRNLLCAAALLSLALVGSGCKKSPSLVGKWTGTMQGQNAEFEFKPDNTMSIGSKVGKFGTTFTGDYKLDGEKLTLTLKDVQMAGIPAAQQAMAKNLFAQVLNKPETAKVAFTSDDAVTITGDAPAGGAAGMPKGATAGQTMALTRVKEGS